MDVRVTFVDSMLNGGLVNQIFAGRTRFVRFYVVFNCNIAVDRKQLVASFPEELWGRLSPIGLYNFVILA